MLNLDLETKCLKIEVRNFGNISDDRITKAITERLENLTWLN